MRPAFSQLYRFSFIVSALGMATFSVAAGPADKPSEDGGFFGIYLVSALAIAGLGGGYFFWKKSRKSPDALPKSQYDYQMTYNHDGGDSYQMDGAGAARDLETLRRASRTGKKRANGNQQPAPDGLPTPAESIADTRIDTKAFQERMRKLQYAHLPINSFSQLADAKKFTPLHISNDPSLLTAIEQVNEEYEEDESVRDLALRILTPFRNRNSIEAISQLALYDLSANLRSKAVAVLADFDHESVFETILLACADPTREVRAAAARGLFKLGFDRAHAWKRILETNDEFRMSHASRAAVESGIVSKSFDRLVHEDIKIAYEAFALVSLLIKSGETACIIEAIRDHKDERVKYALLHVLEVHRDPRTLDKLQELCASRAWPADVSDRMRDTIESLKSEAAVSGRKLVNN